MTNTQLKQYIKRQLGEPVITVEIADEQLDDAIDDTLILFTEGHYDGRDLTYITITVSQGISATTLSSNVQEVLEIINKRALYIFDEKLMLSPLLYPGGSGSIGTASGASVELEVMRQAFKMAEDNFQSKVMFDYNQTTKKLHLLVPPKEDDTYVGMVYVSETDYQDYYSNRWVKKMATAQAKLTWGGNIGKYSGSLVGGASLNYDRIISEAQTEIDKLLIELESKYSQPASFYCG